MTGPAAATKLNKAMSTLPRSTPNMTAGEHSASPLSENIPSGARGDKTRIAVTRNATAITEPMR